LFRFARTFGRQYRKFDLYVGSVTTLLIVWTFAISHFPESGEPRPAQFVAYLVVFLIHFAVLLVFVAWRLWTAGRGLPSVARRPDGARHDAGGGRGARDRAARCDRRRAGGRGPERAGRDRRRPRRRGRERRAVRARRAGRVAVDLDDAVRALLRRGGASAAAD